MMNVKTIFAIALMLLWANGSLIAGSLEPMGPLAPTMKLRLDTKNQSAHTLAYAGVV